MAADDPKLGHLLERQIACGTSELLRALRYFGMKNFVSLPGGTIINLDQIASISRLSGTRILVKFAVAYGIGGTGVSSQRVGMDVIADGNDAKALVEALKDLGIETRFLENPIK